MPVSFTLEPFSQGYLLRNETDPAVAGGVCVAFCNIWLGSILNWPELSPADRMRWMGHQIGAAKAHQKDYGRKRRAMGRVAARAAVGAPLGLGFDEQTVVMRHAVGRAGIEAKIVADLRAPGAAAAWTMRFRDGGGHAIAGINRLEQVTSNIARMHAHVFDPNVGEYAVPFADLPQVVDDLFSRVPLYGTVTELHRADVSF